MMEEEIVIPYGPFLEEWKDVVGFEEYYAVSQYGRVISKERTITISTGRICILKQRFIKTPKKEGYPYFNYVLNKRKTPAVVHREVAKLFLPIVEGKPFVNHKNGIKSDPFYLNLEWCTHQENIMHAFKHKLIKRSQGEKHINSKLSDYDVSEIRKLIREGLSLRELEKVYPVTNSTLSKIKLGNAWKHVI